LRHPVNSLFQIPLRLFAICLILAEIRPTDRQGEDEMLGTTLETERLFLRPPFGAEIDVSAQSRETWRKQS